MDKGYCAGTMLFQIQNGMSNGINLGGRTLAIATDFPGPTVLDGNGTARMYIDDTADAKQLKELEDIFQGKRGGPMAVVSQLVTKNLPTKTAKIEIREDGRKLTAKVGGFGQMKSEQLINESGKTVTLHGAGFASVFQYENEVITLAPSGTEWSDPDMPRPFSTKSGTVANFSWRGN